MDNQLRKIQMMQLELALEVKSICDKHNIKYFLDAGTLLGAIRHKGFIPWDDDMDIGFLRSDYEKFIKIAKHELPNKYFLQTWDIEEGYALPFAKIRKNNTLYVEEKSAKANIHKGIYIDIFAYDNVSDKAMQRVFQTFIVKMLFKIILVKNKFEPWNGEKIIKKIGYYPIVIISFFISKEKAKKCFMKWSTKYNDVKCKEKILCDGNFFYKYKFEENILNNLVDVEFEGQKFSAPLEFEKYLKKLYGDYMTLPPENQRYNRHGIIKVKL